MYCIHCGVKLADTEKVCPLCGTEVFHPHLRQPEAVPLYPRDRAPHVRPRNGAVNGSILALFLLPLLITFLVDLRTADGLSWFGFAAGGLAVAYVVFALPRWFRRPNPVIFVPCGFAAAALYLLYIDLTVDGGWFLPFAFPVTAGLALIVCAVVVLLRCLRRGRLYIVGGAVMALGGLTVLIEGRIAVCFSIPFVGWSFYPLAAMLLLGGLLIFLAINGAAREKMERRLFF